MNFLQTLFDTRQPPGLYVMKAALVSLVPTVVMSVLFLILFPQWLQVELPADVELAFFGIVILTPIIETLLMWPLIALISLMTKNTWVIAFNSAFAWAVFHSLSAPVWGLSIFWSFVVFSIGFVEWGKKSKVTALWVTCAVHMLQNFVNFALMRLGELYG